MKLVNPPIHLAIIMDGNSRWAESEGRHRDEGHRAGAKHVRTIAEACADLGVRYLSLFAFSTENWDRPRDEVDFLIHLIGETLDNELDELVERETKVQFIGERSRFPSQIQRKMLACEARTAKFEKLFLTIALNYGGRWDLTNATRELTQAVQHGYLQPDEINESVIASYLATRNLPSPDLCIRTGGDRRISNFMLWDFAYTEFCFVDCFWPAFEIDVLQTALVEYGHRQRRFGGRRELNRNPSLVESS
ncbi:MAG: polyprenyl diphosphate synthase [Gammaproteobacteria bacterium]|nr:polyprenyl diphosphate synthase [Gammaproteobacteria bacterium]